MKSLRTFLFALAPVFALAAASAPATAPSPAIQEIKDVASNEKAFAASGATKPIVIKSEKDAGDYFDDKELAKLVKQVDFKNQIVLVFAWSGSGQDKLDYTVAESFPEQIHFAYTPGRTRDLRQQVHVYALRSDVTWNAK